MVVRISQLVLQLLYAVRLSGKDALRDVSVAALAADGLLRHVGERVQTFTLVQQVESRVTAVYSL